MAIERNSTDNNLVRIIMWSSSAVSSPDTAKYKKGQGLYAPPIELRALVNL